MRYIRHESPACAHAGTAAPRTVSGCCGEHGDHAEAEARGHESAPRACAHQHDHAHAHAEAHSHDHGHDACCDAAAAVLAPLAPAAHVADGRVRTAIRIMQMDCPTEEALIRKKLGQMPSVHALDFNLMQRVLTVVHAPNALAAILAALRTLDFTPELAESGASPAPAAPRRRVLPLAIAACAAAAAEAASWSGAPVWLTAALAIAAIAVCGLGTYRKGWIALRHLNLNINALMSLAVTGASILGQWPEAAMVMVLFTLAELIEARSLERARHAIGTLMQLAPPQATVQQPDGSWLTLDVAQVAPGQIVRVKPGERIALDGEIVAGRSSIDQAPITGESLPVDKALGDAVFAGTINGAGAIDFRVRTAAADSTLARIIHAVEAAQGAKAPTQRFVDRFARIYTPIVFALALCVAVAGPLLTGSAWHAWIYKALVMLVIACPCALVISTPVTIVSGLAAAARHGILVKGGAYLEQGRRIKWLALDKTGTITQGKPVQTDAEACADASLARCRILAASLAARSDHPVSQALAAAARAGRIALADVQAFEALPGSGVRGTIDGADYWLGNHRLVETLGRCTPALEARLDVLEREGKTVVMLMDAQQVLALFGVADAVKDSSRAAIARLHALGVRTAMLTGDNPHTAAAIAGEVGIDTVRGNQMPEDKLAAVEALMTDGATVAMVGDGINDAPALARADIGIAMGAMGTDTAIETADVALMDDDLRKLATFIRLSRATHGVLVQNIALALGIKVVFLALTLMGYGTMWMAVFADAGASLLVVGNGLRLLRR
jgi:Cd2+/Zn2+-exporting ATPase